MRKSKKLIRLVICMSLCGTLVPLATWVVCHYLPRKYTSAASIPIKSEPDPSAALNAGLVWNSPDSTDPRFIADQANFIRSRTILYPVIRELKLIDKWSAGLPTKLSNEEAYRKLAKMTTVTRKGDTAFVNVAVTSTDSQEAADIANTIIVIYQKGRKHQLVQQITNALSELFAQVDKRQQIVDAAKAALETIRARDNVRDPNPGDLGTPVVPSNAEYEMAKKKYLEAKKVFDSLKDEYVRSTMDLKIDLVPAESWAKAEPAIAPLTPDIPRIMTAAACVGILCALCGVGLVTARLYRRQREDASSCLNPPLASQLQAQGR
jgi:uncharacterized protein involved in exopolysaccharide biosynthesis